MFPGLVQAITLSPNFIPLKVRARAVSSEVLNSIKHAVRDAHGTI